MSNKKKYKERFSQAELFVLSALNRANLIYEHDTKIDRIINQKHNKREREEAYIFNEEQYKEAGECFKFFLKNLRIEIAKDILGVNTKKLRGVEDKDREKEKRNNLKSRFSKQLKNLKKKGCIEYKKINPHRLYPSPSIDYSITPKGHLILKEHLIGAT